jgi:hypothetical protein
MKVSVFLDKDSADILTMVLGQAGYESEVIDGIRKMKTNYLFLSNGKFSLIRYLYTRYKKIVYLVVRDVPAINSWLSRKFYLSSMGEISYPTKSSEVDKCVRAMMVSSYKLKTKKKK